MNSDFRKIISKPVIRLEDVAGLRAHIELRHPEFDPQVRAGMMADDINRMLDAAMTGIEPEHREIIKKNLISEQLIGNRQSILKLDVMNRILALDMKPDQLMTKTWGWYVLNTGQPVTLSEFVEQASPYLPHRVRDAVRDAAERNLTYQSSGKMQGFAEDTYPDVSQVEPDPKGPSELIIRLRDYKKRIQDRFKQVLAYRLTKKGQMATLGAAAVIMLAAMVPQIFGSVTDLTHTPGITSSAFAPPQEYRVIGSDYGVASDRLEKPTYLRYQNVSLEHLKSFLDQKHSKLLTEDYLDQLLGYSYEKDLNPLLLIAIIGQEQNYVPLQHPYAQRMIENPFNIYGSWETHPVGFTASMKEACYTINKALEGRRLYSDPFEVINGVYAEDEGWHLGVKVIFRDLMGVAGG